MTSAIDLAAAIRILLEPIRPYMSKVSQLDWYESQGVLPIVRIAICRRQYDCLEAIVDLVRQDRGYAAATLLRPSCEEYLWTKYIKSLTPEQGEELLLCRLRSELYDQLKVQDDYAGRSITTGLGLLEPFKRLEKSRESDQERLRSLGRTLNWDARTIKNGDTPAASFVAKRVGETRLYNFLYHA